MRRDINDVVFINEKEKKSSTAKTGQRKISVVSLVIHCHLLHHSLSLVTTQCTTSVFL